MKKIILTLTFLTLLFTLTACSSSSKLKSLNEFLEYDLVEGWQNMESSTSAELALETTDGNAGLMLEYIEKNSFSMEEFLDEQDEALLQTGCELIEEQTVGNIYYRVYEYSDEYLGTFRFLSGTIENTKDEDVYAGFVATIYEESITTDDILEVLNNISFTNVKLEDTKTIIPDDEYLQITMPGYWRRYDSTLPLGFYKSLTDGILYSHTMTELKEYASPTEAFDTLLESFEYSYPDATVYIDTNTQELDGKTIINKVYEYTLDDESIAYTSINVIDFTDSEMYAISNFDLCVEGGYESVKDELDSIILSIKIKSGGEKQLSEDLQAYEESLQQLQEAETETDGIEFEIESIESDTEEEILEETSEELIEELSEEMQEDTSDTIEDTSDIAS